MADIKITMLDISNGENLKNSFNTSLSNNDKQNIERLNRLEKDNKISLIAKSSEIVRIRKNIVGDHFFNFRKGIWELGSRAERKCKDCYLWRLSFREPYICKNSLHSEFYCEDYIDKRKLTSAQKEEIDRQIKEETNKTPDSQESSIDTSNDDYSKITF